MATLEQLEKGLKAAYESGNMEYARVIAAELVKARKDPVNQIPGMQVQGAPVEAAPTGIMDKMAGPIEAAATIATGATGGAAGLAGGLLYGIGGQIVNGTMGTPDGLRQTMQTAQDASAALTYMPRSQTGQAILQGVGELAQGLPPVLPMIGQAGAIGQSVRAAAPLAVAAGQRVAAPAARAAQSTAGRIRSAMAPAEIIPGEPVQRAGSIGAAATPIELQRVAEAEMAGLKLTEGEIKRSPAVLAWEKEKAKTPEYQAPFVERQQENNRNALLKLDNLIDDTGAETGNLADTGVKVVDALMKGWKDEKSKTTALYNAFRASPEAQTPVDHSPVIDFLNSQPVGVAGITGVTDTVRQNVVRLGLAAPGPDGNLVPIPTTLGKLEDLRQSVSAIGTSSTNDKRLVSILKRQIDDAGGPVGGQITGAMRAQRRNQAVKYENRAIVSRLLLEKKGFSDPQTPIEEVFNKTILTARPSEIQHIKRVLLVSGGDEGKQAWKELQGATLRHLQSAAESGIGADNLPVISAAKLNKAVQAMDKNGKLDLVLGTQAAEQVRNLNQVLQYIQSTPPMTSINNSGTARTVMALLAESAATGAVTGVPLPLVQGLKMIRENVKDRRIKARIDAALNYKPKAE